MLTYGCREIGVGRVIGIHKGSITGRKHSELVGSGRWVKQQKEKAQRVSETKDKWDQHISQPAAGSRRSSFIQEHPGFSLWTAHLPASTTLVNFGQQLGHSNDPTQLTRQGVMAAEFGHGFNFPASTPMRILS